MRKYLDLLLAGTVLLLAAVASITAYGRVIDVERGVQHELAGVPLGKFTFNAFQGSDCFGSLNTDTKTEPADVFIANGKLRLQYQGQRVVATVFAAAYFNPFGQLVSGEFKISSPQSSFLVQLKNPNPIHLTVTFNGPHSKSENQFELPGPVLSERTKNSIVIKYDLFEKQSRSMMTGVAQGLALGSLAQLNLHVERSPEGTDRCDIANDGGPALQVDTLMTLLNLQRDRLKELVPGLLGAF